MAVGGLAGSYGGVGGSAFSGKGRSSSSSSTSSSSSAEKKAYESDKATYGNDKLALVTGGKRTSSADTSTSTSSANTISTTGKAALTDKVSVSSSGTVTRQTTTGGKAYVGTVDGSTKTMTVANANAAQGVTVTTKSAAIDYKDTIGQTKTFTSNTTTFDMGSGLVKSSVDYTQGFAGISTKGLIDYTAKKAASTGGLSAKTGFDYNASLDSLNTINEYEETMTDYEKEVLNASNYYMKVGDGALLLDVDSAGNISGYALENALPQRVVSLTASISEQPLTSASAPTSLTSSSSPTSATAGTGASTGAGAGAAQASGAQTPVSANNQDTTYAQDTGAVDWSWLLDLFAPSDNEEPQDTGTAAQYVYDDSQTSQTSTSALENIFNTIKPYIIPGLLATGIVVVGIKLMTPTKTQSSSAGKKTTAA